ncbi:hypothetical protein U9M48_001029 [Paspalum notatum var. saurae]|uniref:Protein kinase domain-containing protein n=1 Tax=Paspalum notatum var. saurae TaxID=547442 RepID=A0AAQ3SHU1_PASNO
MINIWEYSVARKFSYPKLAAATNNFSEDRKLGAGSFGEVYRGDLQDPSMPPVAVKRLTTMMQRTMTDYVTEVTTLGRISHRNLVRLVGWCDGGGDGDNAKLLLVYELVARGSLDRHLHGSDSSDWRLLTWAERYKIVLDIGYAIVYLHTGCPSPILHRDIKPSNVMLDDDLVAKLGDFGLVRQAPGRGQGTLAGTAMIGSSDYIDPVCISNGTVSTASDMYSFGVLLLEMATGRDPAEMRESSIRQYALAEAVQESYRRAKVLQMADDRLNGNYVEWQMERVLVVGLLCVQAHRQDRPTIKESMAMLSYPAHTVPAVQLPMYPPITKTAE